MKERRMQPSAGKRAVAWGLLALTLLLLAGCGTESVFNGSRTANESGFEMEYTALNREETADLTLSAGDQLRVVIAQTGGNVDVTVGQEGKEPLYRGTKQENADFVLTAPETGSYHISVVGHQAKGRVSFTRVPGTVE